MLCVVCLHYSHCLKHSMDEAHALFVLVPIFCYSYAHCMGIQSRRNNLSVQSFRFFQFVDKLQFMSPLLQPRHCYFFICRYDVDRFITHRIITSGEAVSFHDIVHLVNEIKDGCVLYMPMKGLIQGEIQMTRLQYEK